MLAPDSDRTSVIAIANPKKGAGGRAYDRGFPALALGQRAEVHLAACVEPTPARPDYRTTFAPFLRTFQKRDRLVADCSHAGMPSPASS